MENSETAADGEVSELLIWSDGKIFVHNLTPSMAALLAELNPDDTAMRDRAAVETATTSTFTPLCPSAPTI